MVICVLHQSLVMFFPLKNQQILVIFSVSLDILRLFVIWKTLRTFLLEPLLTQQKKEIRI